MGDETVEGSRFEIVIGLVGPLATDLDAVIMELERALKEYEYSSTRIRLSELLQVSNGQKRGREELMTAGDELRRSKGGAALAAKAIKAIHEARASEDPGRRHAWILRTLKHDAEVSLLRKVYGQRFVLIGAQEEKAKRERSLLALLKDEGVQEEIAESKVVTLMQRDEKDLRNQYGQQGRDVYARADYFIDLSSGVATEQVVANMVSLLFGKPFITPTRDEVGMFHAHGASLRSADAGRQVGAAITRETGEIVVTGSNEVPKFGGGEYWIHDEPDARDFMEGVDFNKRQINRSLREILDELHAAGALSSELDSLNPGERFKKVMEDAPSIKSTRLFSLIEFGRVVHAEMSALMQAARTGVSVEGCTLYTTAFPCHMCMRLIIAAGIRRVVYVDPYPKSLAVEMYADSISLDPMHTGKKLVAELFTGASWRIYPIVFSSANREKDPDGRFKQFDKAKSRFRLAHIDPFTTSSDREKEAYETLDS